MPGVRGAVPGVWALLQGGDNSQKRLRAAGAFSGLCQANAETLTKIAARLPHPFEAGPGRNSKAACVMLPSASFNGDYVAARRHMNPRMIGGTGWLQSATRLTGRQSLASWELARGGHRYESLLHPIG